MPRAIEDDLTNDPTLSRQRRYQIRKEREGRCRICGDLAPKGKSLCVDHQIDAQTFSLSRSENKTP
jgi:hypothetical protein